MAYINMQAHAIEHRAIVHTSALLNHYTTMGDTESNIDSMHLLDPVQAADGSGTENNADHVHFLHAPVRADAASEQDSPAQVFSPKLPHEQSLGADLELDSLVPAATASSRSSVARHRGATHA
jgi:hypothetical protein